MNVIFEPFPNTLDPEIAAGFSCNIPQPANFSSRRAIPKQLAHLALEKILPHKQFTVSFEYLKELNPLFHAIFVGWRFFEWTDEGALGARLVWINTIQNEQSGLIYFNIGRFVAGSLVGLQTAQAFPSTGNFYFRILALPQIYIFAIWLHRFDSDGSGQSDLLIPINPEPDGGGAPAPITPFEPLNVYSPEAFFVGVRDRLREAEIRCPPPRLGSADA